MATTSETLEKTSGAQLATDLSAIDLNLLIVLTVLLEESSVTRAALRLRRTQSAVSHSLERLREALKDPLFVRSGQQMIPTPRAEELRAEAMDLTSRIRHLFLGAARFDPQSSRHRVRVTASDYLQIVLIPAIVHQLRTTAKGVSLDVVGPKSRLLERLSRGELDFSFSVYMEETTSLYSQKVFSDRFVCLVSETHPAVQTGLSLETYLELPHVLVAPLGGATGHVDKELQRLGKSRNVAVLLPDFMVAPRVLAGTDLIVTLPERVARLFVNERVHILPPPLPLPTLTAHLVWHERLSRDVKSIWFRRLVHDVSIKLNDQ